MEDNGGKIFCSQDAWYIIIQSIRELAVLDFSDNNVYDQRFVLLGTKNFPRYNKVYFKRKTSIEFAFKSHLHCI